MLKMVDGTGIIGVDMICPLGVSTPQPPNYDRVELEGAGMLVLPNSLDAPLEGLELGGKTEQVQTTGANLFDEKLLLDFDSENYDKTQSGSGFYYYKFPVNGTVTASTKNANKNGEYLTVGIKPDGSDKTWLSHGSAAISKYKTLTPEDGNIYLGVNNSLERVKSMIQNTGGIIINEGSAAKPYEPYTGGKPSPSPEYPQEIKNSGMWNEETRKYEVDVKVTGRNLFNGKLLKGKSITDDMNVVSDLVTMNTFDKPVEIEPNTDYVISANGVIWEGNINVYDENGKKIVQHFTGKFKTPSNAKYIRASISNARAPVDSKIQMEYGTAMNEFEQYHQPQTLTLTSDRPLTKWDRLVEQGGQIGWLYKSKIIDGFDGQSSNITLGGKQGEVQHFSVVFTDVPNGNGNGDIYVDRYRAIAMSYTKAEFGICCNWNIGVKFFSAPNENVTTVQEFKTWLVENPLKIAYETTNPEFVPLPQSEQNAIRALKTYYPTTVITADGGELDPDIKVTYRKEI
jgi:hypothetical protein